MEGAFGRVVGDRRVGLGPVQASQRDLAGNTSGLSPAVTFTVIADVTPPDAPTIIDPASNAIVPATFAALGRRSY